jgi:hypothetical protein
MRLTVDVSKKYSGCRAENPLENSTLAAAAALAALLAPFVSVVDTYVLPPSSGGMNPDGSITRYSLAEMQADKVPANMPLMLYLDVQALAGGKVNSAIVGITIQDLRLQPNDAAGALAKAIGSTSDTVLALFTRALYGNVVADLNARSAAVIAAEDSN